MEFYGTPRNSGKYPWNKDKMNNERNDNMPKNKKHYNPIIATIGSIALVIAVILFIVDIFNPRYGFFAKVDAGYAGVVDYFGDVRDEPLKPGFHITKYFEHVHPVSIRTQKNTNVIEAFSSDIQQVIMTLSINYNVSEENAGILYKKIGTHYYETLIDPKLQENAKVVVSRYTAESLIENRDHLSKAILDKMVEDISPYGIKVTDVSIENIDFTDAFEAAVEAKQVATQEKQRAKTVQEQQTMEAEQAAAREKIKAESEANVRKIQAEAEAYEISTKAQASADANKKISESLTNELIEYTKAQNWDGKLPATFVGDEGALPIINTNPTNDIWDEFEKSTQNGID